MDLIVNSFIGIVVKNFAQWMNKIRISYSADAKINASGLKLVISE